jgi:DNA gyrase subunit A
MFDLLACRSIVVMTSSGYIKRMPIDEFESQNRGSRGKLGANIKSDLLTNSSDSVMHFLSCRDHDTMLFVTNRYFSVFKCLVFLIISFFRGYAYSMPAFKIPLSSRTSRGTPITQLLSFKDGETNTAMFSFDENISNKSCIMLTKCGRVKKLHVADIKGKSKLRRGTKVVGLLSGDSLSWARLSEETEDVLIATRYLL